VRHVPEVDVDAHLLGAQQVEGLGRIQRGAMSRIAAESIVDTLPLRAIVRGTRMRAARELRVAIIGDAVDAGVLEHDLP
jgi:hypothetical protein